MLRFSMTRAARVSTALGAGLIVMALSAPAEASPRFKITNLVSDGSAPAATTDANLINPWGIAASPTGPFWVADNGTNVSTLYNTAGVKSALTVNIPPSGSSPTGIVFNGTTGFKVGENTATGVKTGAAAFIFATEAGGISGWSPGVDIANSVTAVDNSALGAGAVYKGLAIGTNAGATFLYATDFRNGLVEQFDSNYNLVRSFTDPSVAAGYAPFGIQTLGSHLFVTYALQNASKHDEISGAGLGYVDEFNLDGTFARRLVSAGGQVDSPWGLTIAPTSFKGFAGDLLVGNFGDGTISAFDAVTGTFRGQLLGADNNPLVVNGLWGLINGNGGRGGDLSKVYFTAGGIGEAHGLLGSIAAVPEPETWAMMLFGLGLVGFAMRKRNRGGIPITLG